MTSADQVLALTLAALAALLVYAAATLTARYRVVWVRLSRFRWFVTRAAATGDAFLVWDRWRGRWVL